MTKLVYNRLYAEFFTYCLANIEYIAQWAKEDSQTDF